ncbi:hypothetical protein M3Y95_00715900 [Aphelenchoides besseyi]|nr:hypothetical protein M3Y95_00715900 [Aphelenchoides besseyi]
MSYPSNSSFIDLRSKIRTPVSKTKLILQELEQLSSGKTKKRPIHELENTRWISSGGDATLPPRRSSFTPSRIQEISANLNKSVLRNRNDALPYWRRTFNNKPRPTTYEPLEDGDLSMNGIDSSTPIPPPSSSTEKESTTPASRHQPILKTVNRRTIVSNDKPNVFSLNDPEENDDVNTSALEKIAPLPAFGQKLTGGFLKNTVEEEAAFQFDPPEVRGPRAIPVEKPVKETPQVTPKPSSDSESVISEVGSDSESDNSVVPQKEATLPPPISEPKIVEITQPTPVAAATASAKWTCGECWVPNESSVESCVCCSAPKPGSQPKSDENAAPTAPKQVFKPTNFAAAVSSTPSTFQFGFGAANPTPAPVIAKAPEVVKVPEVVKPPEVLQTNGTSNGKIPQFPSISSSIPPPSFNFSSALNTTGPLPAFKFGSETAVASTSSSAPFQFGSAATAPSSQSLFQFGSTNAPTPALPTFQMGSAPSAATTAGGAMGRKKLMARRKHN